MKKECAAGVMLCICLLNCKPAVAQYYFYNDKYYAADWVTETGFSAGIMNSLTDLGGRKGIGKDFIKDLNWKVTRPCFGVYVLSMYRDAIGFRLETTIGKIESYDSILKKSYPDLIQRYGRNLSFRSTIKDLQLALEIHPLFFRQYDEYTAPYWSPYVIAGIGYFFFHPQANLEGQWYDLHSLHLEGQGFAEYPTHRPYRLSQFNIPVGIGLRYEINTFLYARIEMVSRILFTDYLDDVSTTYIDARLFAKHLSPARAAIAGRLYSRMQELQPRYIVKPGMERGDSKDNDSFFSVELKLGWVMRKKR